MAHANNHYHRLILLAMQKCIIIPAQVHSTALAVLEPLLNRTLHQSGRAGMRATADHVTPAETGTTTVSHVTLTQAGVRTTTTDHVTQAEIEIATADHVTETTTRITATKIAAVLNTDHVTTEITLTRSELQRLSEDGTTDHPGIMVTLLFSADAATRRVTKQPIAEHQLL